MKKIFILALAFAALSSCTKNVQEVAQNVELSDIPVSFSSSISKVSNNEFVTDDAIGIFMIQATTLVQSNVHYVFSATEEFEYASTPVYYPMAGEKVAFYAYYPYEVGAATYTNVSIVDQTVPFLEALTEADYEKADYLGDVELTFKHKLAGLDITVVGSGSTPELTQVVVSGAPTTGVYSFTNMDYVEKRYDGTTVDIVADLTTRADADKCLVYLFPTESAGVTLYSLEDAMLEITTTDGYYEVSLASLPALESNVALQCTVTLNLTEIEGIGGGIVSWDSTTVDKETLGLTY